MPQQFDKCSTMNNHQILQTVCSLRLLPQIVLIIWHIFFIPFPSALHLFTIAFVGKQGVRKQMSTFDRNQVIATDNESTINLNGLTMVMCWWGAYDPESCIVQSRSSHCVHSPAIHAATHARTCLLWGVCLNLSHTCLLWHVVPIMICSLILDTSLNSRIMINCPNHHRWNNLSLAMQRRREMVLQST